MTLNPTDEEWPPLKGRQATEPWAPPRTGLIGQRVIDDHALIEPGCMVWSSVRKDWRLQPKGGMVVARTDALDFLTGELVPAFLCLNPYVPPREVGSARLIRADEIGPEGAEGFDAGVRTRLVRRLCALVSTGKAGYLDTHELQVCSWIGRLAAVGS